MQGELGVGDLKDKLDPKTVEGFPSSIISLGCGDHHCLAITGIADFSGFLCFNLTEIGDLYTWGRGREGQLGTGRVMHYSNVPLKVTSLESERMVKVVAFIVSPLLCARLLGVQNIVLLSLRLGHYTLGVCFTSTLGRRNTLVQTLISHTFFNL